MNKAYLLGLQLYIVTLGNAYIIYLKNIIVCMFFW